MTPISLVPNDGKVVLTPEQLLQTEDLAEGLSVTEVCDFFMIEEKDIQNRREFDLHYKKGRAVAAHFAMSSLKKQMGGRQGLQAALAHLTRFGADWPVDTEDKLGNGKTFKVIMDD